MHEHLRAEFLRLLAVAALIGLFGVVSGAWALALLLGLGGLLLWQLYQLWLFEEWLGGNRGVRGELRGLWDGVAARMERMRAQARRRKKRLSRMLHQFHDTLETMPDAAVILDDRGRVQWFNPAARALLGLDDAAPGQTVLAERLEDPDLDAWLREGGPGPLERRYETPRQRDLELRLAPFARGQWLLTAHDVTELKRVQTVRREFVANVSHELRTPLTVIVGYLEMLADDALPEATRTALRASLRQAERMQRLVSDLLMLSRLELDERPPPQETVDVRALLEQLREDARRLDGGRHPLRLRLDCEAALRGSESELASAFGNLLFNALLHTPDGTPVEMRWHCESGRPTFCVRDRGPGIPPEHLDRLTERFYRVDKSRSRERGGTGLGLSIVRHVLLRHGARIEIESRVGEGSRFCCIFPGERLAPAPGPAGPGDTRDRP